MGKDLITPLVSQLSENTRSIKLNLSTKQNILVQN